MRLYPAIISPASARFARRRYRCTGFTFVELMMGLAITGMVMGALAAFSLAVSNAWDQTFPPATAQATGSARAVTSQSLFLSGTQTNLRIQSLLRQARATGNVRAGSLTSTSVQPASIMIWKEDKNSDGSIQFDEIGLLEYDLSNKRLLLYAVQWPAGSTDAFKAARNTTFSYSAIKASTAQEDFKKLQYVVGNPFGRGVIGAQFAMEDMTHAQRPSFQYVLNLSRGTDTQTIYGAATLRAPLTPQP